MPIFEFKCNKCDTKFEMIVFKPLTECEIICPECSSKEIEKLVSAPGMVAGSASESYSSRECSSCSSKFT
jgi:putative FmdB family regulatory protein